MSKNLVCPWCDQVNFKYRHCESCGGSMKGAKTIGQLEILEAQSQPVDVEEPVFQAPEDYRMPTLPKVKEIDDDDIKLSPGGATLTVIFLLVMIGALIFGLRFLYSNMEIQSLDDLAQKITDWSAPISILSIVTAFIWTKVAGPLVGHNHGVNHSLLMGILSIAMLPWIISLLTQSL